MQKETVSELFKASAGLENVKSAMDDYNNRPWLISTTHLDYNNRDVCECAFLGLSTSAGILANIVTWFTNLRGLDPHRSSHEIRTLLWV